MAKKNKYIKHIGMVSRNAKKLIQTPKISIDKQNGFYIVSPLQARHTTPKFKIDLSMRFREEDTNKINLVERQLTDFHNKGGKILVSSRVLAEGVWPPFIKHEIRKHIMIKDLSKLKK